MNVSIAYNTDFLVSSTISTSNLMIFIKRKANGVVLSISIFFLSLIARFFSNLAYISLSKSFNKYLNKDGTINVDTLHNYEYYSGLNNLVNKTFPKLITNIEKLGEIDKNNEIYISFSRLVALYEDFIEKSRDAFNKKDNENSHNISGFEIISSNSLVDSKIRGYRYAV